MKRSKSIVFVTLTFLLSLLIGLSYGVFMITTGKYNATNMLISNLMYKIDISTTGGSETINGKTVNLSGGNTSTVLVKIESLNPIDTNYQLEYKITEGEGSISYASNTGWLPQGNLSKSNGLVYVKTVKVVIEATTNLTVDFNVSGGYTHDNNIIALEGYNKIINEYDKIYNYTEESNLKDIIEEETNCESTPCLYGGQSVNNYLQYPSSTDLNENIWRITGTQDLEDYVALKLIGNIRSTTNVSGINSSLSNIYTSSEKKEDYIYLTNKFNCNETGCNTSNYENIGLLSTYEYNKIGGLNSYLASSNNFYSLNETNIENITPSGVEETSDATTSGIRPVIYLQSDVNVTGSGTASDPYRLSSKGDIIMASATLNNGPFKDKPEGYFPSESDPYIVKSVSCTNGTVGHWDEEKKTIILTTPNLPTTCTVDFSEGYTVEMYGVGATIGDPTSQVVGRIGETSFNFTTETGYNQSTAIVTCDNGATPSLNENTINITNIKESQKCTLTLKKEPTLAEAVIEAYTPLEGRTDFSVIDNGDPALYTGSDDQGTTYYFSGDGSSMNNWVSFAGKLWRIIRINGNGSVRLLYAGSGSTDGYIGSATSPYQLSIDNKCSGYNVTANITNGYISTSENVKSVSQGGTVEFLIQPNGGYMLVNATVTGGCTLDETTGILTANNVTSAMTCNVELKENPNTLANRIKTDNASITKGERTDFSDIYETTALHTAPDYSSSGAFNGTTYYFTGNPNNWVSFAGKKWRIIRINGDGSVRLLYAGSGSTDGYISAQAYNGSYNNPAYVGWKYGTSGQNGRGSTVSPIYNTVSSWYKTNITNAGLGNYIETNAVYCNDRTASTSSTNDTSYTTFTASNNLGTTYYYGGYKRLYNKGTPTLECNASDQFKDGFGLMTADEVVLAGGLWQTNNSSAYYYLNASGDSTTCKNSPTTSSCSSTGDKWWWTMSPYYWNDGSAFVFVVSGSSGRGHLTTAYVNNSSGFVRPVVSLKSNVLVTGGDGSGNSPYTVTLP